MLGSNKRYDKRLGLWRAVLFVFAAAITAQFDRLELRRLQYGLRMIYERKQLKPESNTHPVDENQLPIW